MQIKHNSFKYYHCKRIHLLSDLYFSVDNSSMDISIIHAKRAVNTPISKKTNHLARFFLIMNLYPFFLSSSSNKWFSHVS